MSLVGAYAIGKSRRPDQPDRALPDALQRERLDRLERMVESMADEMERMGEGQRFLLKTLEKQGARNPDILRVPSRTVTPH